MDGADTNTSGAPRVSDQPPLRRPARSRRDLALRWAGGTLLVLLLAPVWLWAIGGLALHPAWPGWARAVTASLAIVLVPASLWLWRWPAAVGAVVLLALCVAGLLALVRPTGEGDWTADQARLARVELDGDRVTIENVRNATYRTTTDYDVSWETRSYDLSQIVSLDLVVEPFSEWRGLAHTLLTFGFADGEHVAISVEIRKRQGDSYSPIKGLYRHYEVCYVIGDERDLIGLRANIRHDPVYLYPVRGSRDQIRAMFVDMLEQAEALASAPEFYNSVTNTCATSIAWHMSKVTGRRIRFDHRILFPGYADELALERGTIDFDGDIQAARETFQINSRSQFGADGKVWSRQIRTR